MRRWMVFCLGTALSASVTAEPFEVVGSKPVAIPSNEASGARSAHPKKHIVYLQKMKLSEDAQRIMSQRAKQAWNNPSPYQYARAAVASSVTPNMNGVPVLDQGEHGSCVTFAVTGAINAILPGLSKAHPDYVSQLCSLAFGNYLATTIKDPKVPYGGWDGTYADAVLYQLTKYGYIPNSYQKAYGCAPSSSGISSLYKAGKLYPILHRYDPLVSTRQMSTNYINKAKPLVTVTRKGRVGVQWASVLNYTTYISSAYNPDKTLNKVKQHLRENKHLVFGMMLDGSTGGYVGASGRKAVENDTWVLTNKIKNHATTYPGLQEGHEMIIVGYNDNASAVIKDDNGKKIGVEKGLLILRNSWGAFAGDKGNYYVSYSYFKVFATDIQVLCTAKLGSSCAGVDTIPVRK